MGNKKSKAVLYNLVLAEVMNLNLDRYHTIFLANMVVRKMRHPEEKVDKVAAHVMKKMPEIYDKKDVIEISSKKCLENLEVAIDAPGSTVPEDWKSGQCVSHVVKKLAIIVMEKME